MDNKNSPLEPKKSNWLDLLKSSVANAGKFPERTPEERARMDKGWSKKDRQDFEKPYK